MKYPELLFCSLQTGCSTKSSKAQTMGEAEVLCTEVYCLCGSSPSRLTPMAKPQIIPSRRARPLCGLYSAHQKSCFASPWGLPAAGRLGGLQGMQGHSQLQAEQDISGDGV